MLNLLDLSWVRERMNTDTPPPNHLPSLLLPVAIYVSTIVFFSFFCVIGGDICGVFGVDVEAVDGNTHRQS